MVLRMNLAYISPHLRDVGEIMTGISYHMPRTVQDLILELKPDIRAHSQHLENSIPPMGWTQIDAICHRFPNLSRLRFKIVTNDYNLFSMWKNVIIANLPRSHHYLDVSKVVSTYLYICYLALTSHT